MFNATVCYQVVLVSLGLQIGLVTVDAALKPQPSSIYFNQHFKSELFFTTSDSFLVFSRR